MRTDEELLEAWRGGDSESGEQLFDQHFAAVSRFFRNKIGTGLADLVQTTFVALMESRDAFRAEGSSARTSSMWPTTSCDGISATSVATLASTSA